MRRRAKRAQTALEYLLAYGWTLILVGIILFALFELGFFTGSNFVARTQPDTCAVVKINGTTPVLQGTCTNGLPQYVASFNPLLGASYLNGRPGSNFPTGHSSVSEFVWINTLSYNQETVFSFGGTGQGAGISLRVTGGSDSGQISVSDFYKSMASVIPGVNDGTWHFVGFVHPANSSVFDIFVDGEWTNGSVSGSVDLYNGSYFWIGRDPITAQLLNQYSGEMADLQLYDSALSGAQVETLWLGGIGAAPVTTNTLSGWWPLNGNGNDYSGNNQATQLYNVTFATAWTSTYTPPSIPQ